MHVRLVTLSGIQYDNEAQEVQLSTPHGAMVILPNHEPITATTEPGPVTIIPIDGEAEIFANFGGMVEVTQDNVRILLDEVEYATDLVEAEIEAALREAKALKDKAKDQKELDEAQRLIDRHEVRLGVSRIRRRPRS